MISSDPKGNKKFSMNPQVGRAMSAPPAAAAKPAAPALPGMDGDMDAGGMAPAAAEPLNVTCPTCGGQVPVTADTISQPEVDLNANDNSNDLGSMGGSSDEGDMA